MTFQLTVAVPTYNRCDKLAGLAQQFLLSAASMPGIDVLVCDNSDDVEASRNAEIFSGSSVRYIKNPSNLGFHGNLLQCICNARGNWLWTISDDDYVNWEAFTDFIEWLSDFDARDDAVRCIMLPFVGERGAMVNSEAAWRANNGITLNELIKIGRMVPFILFSSAIIFLKNVRVNHIKQVYDQFVPNDFIQTILFSEMIGGDGEVTFWQGKALQVYQHDSDGRFPIKELIRSMDCILNFLESDAIGVPRTDMKCIRRKASNAWAILYARHRAGETCLKQVDSAKTLLWKHVWDYGSYKGVMLLMFAFLSPQILFRFIWQRYIR